MRPVQLGTLVILILMSVWYFSPWLRAHGKAQALTALLWVHVFRYLASFTFSAQHDGWPISDRAAYEVVIADVGGAVLALLAIVALRRHSRFGVVLAWLVVIETIADVALQVQERISTPLAPPSGALWFFLVVFVPAVVVSTVLLSAQLYRRRAEALA